MRVVPLSDEQRREIIQLVKPRRKDLYSYQNLNLLTAVYDEDQEICLTETYYLSAAIQRTNERYDTHQYALLTPLGSFQIYWKEKAETYSSVSGPLPDQLPRTRILELIRYYQDSFSERFRLKMELQKGMELENMGFTEWYLGRYYWK